jgi:hypothetical protein
VGNALITFEVRLLGEELSRTLSDFHIDTGWMQERTVQLALCFENNQAHADRFGAFNSVLLST